MIEHTNITATETPILEQLKNLSLQLFKALNFLKENNYTNKQVLYTLNTLPVEEKLNIKESYFNKLKNFHIESKNPGDVNKPIYKRIFALLNPFIESKFGKIWDAVSESYIDKNQIKSSNILSLENQDRLLGLVGSWKAYAWDEFASVQNQPVGSIHLFKIIITGLKQITCVTDGTPFNNGTNFNEGSMILISTEKALIEFHHNNRRVYMILTVGSAHVDDLKNTSRFKLAYVDSGNIFVKSGLAIIHRIPDSENDFEPITKPANKFGLDEDAIKFLNSSQKVVT